MEGTTKQSSDTRPEHCLTAEQPDNPWECIAVFDENTDEPLEDQLSYLKPTRPTPAQTKVLEELSMTTERLNALLEKTETTGLSSLQQKEYEFLAAQKVELQKKLKRLEVC